jgi:hypothetical protein
MRKLVILVMGITILVGALYLFLMRPAPADAPQTAMVDAQPQARSDAVTAAEPILVQLALPADIPVLAGDDEVLKAVNMSFPPVNMTILGLGGLGAADRGQELDFAAKVNAKFDWSTVDLSNISWG